MATGKALLGLLAGVAAGAALGVLFAPEKGSETRKKIMKQGDGLRSKLTDWTQKGSEKLESLKDGARDLSSDRSRSKNEGSQRDLRTT